MKERRTDGGQGVNQEVEMGSKDGGVWKSIQTTRGPAIVPCVTPPRKNTFQRLQLTHEAAGLTERSNNIFLGSFKLAVNGFCELV